MESVARKVTPNYAPFSLRGEVNTHPVLFSSKKVALQLAGGVSKLASISKPELMLTVTSAR